MEKEYESELVIDADALDVEWLRQAQLFMKYAEAAAKAKKKVDIAKQKLDVAKSEVDRSVRQNPEAYQITGKPTEGAISSAVSIHPDVLNASDAVINANYEYALLSAAVKSFDQKKDALENLVRLHGQSYFASPETPRNLSNEAEKIRDSEVRELNKRLDNKRDRRRRLSKGKEDDSNTEDSG